MSRAERLLFAGLVILSAIVVSRGSHGLAGAAPHYLAVSDSIARDRDLDLRNQLSPDGGFLFESATAGPYGIAREGRGGGLYVPDGLGFSIALTPVLVVVQAAIDAVPPAALEAVRWNRERAVRDLVSIAIALLAAWTAVVTSRITTAVTGRQAGVSMLVAFAFATPPLLTTSFLAFPEIPAAALCAWFVLEQLRPAPRHFALALPLALLPWLHLRYACISVAGVLWVAARDRAGTGGRRTRSWRAVLVWLLASLGAFGALRVWLFGRVLPDLPVDAGWMTIPAVITGLPGLLLDVDFGLLWIAPTWLVVVVGIAHVRRLQPAFARFSARAILGVLAIAAAFNTWRDFGPAAREWVPVLPLLVPFAAEGLRSLAHTRWRWLAYGGAVWSLLLSLVILDRPARLWTEPGSGLGRTPVSAVRRVAHYYMPLDEPAFLRQVEAGNVRAVGLYLRMGLAPEPVLVPAVRAGHADVLRRLLESTAQPGLEAARALLWAQHAGDEQMAAALRASGARVDLTSGRGETALIAAVLYDRRDELAMAIDAGLDLNARTRMGQTALAFAVSEGRADMARDLLAAGADANVADLDGWTPLMAAIRRPQPELVRALLQAHADVNTITRLGWTALMWAAHDGQADIVTALLSAGADVNRTSKAGLSALIRAAAEGHEVIVGYLLEAGADPALTVDGASAHDWAIRNGHTVTAARLSAARGER